MAENNQYEIQAGNLAEAADIAIEAIQKIPPKNWSQAHLDHFANFYNQTKNDVLNPELQFKNLSSLKYAIEIVFTYFQESSGPAINYFWDEIKKKGLPYKRENKLGKILRRKKINDEIEHSFVMDVILPYQQEGLITEEEIRLLNKLIANFEQKKA